MPLVKKLTKLLIQFIEKRLNVITCVSDERIYITIG